MDVLAQVRADHPEAQIMGHADDFTSAGMRLADSISEFGFMSHVLNPNDLIATCLGDSLGYHFKPTDAGWLLIAEKVGIEVDLSKLEMSKLLFGPSDFGLPGLPLRVWFWGLDSC